MSFPLPRHNTCSNIGRLTDLPPGAVDYRPHLGPRCVHVLPLAQLCECPYATPVAQHAPFQAPNW
jgi:hypothetical protein